MLENFKDKKPEIPAGVYIAKTAEIIGDVSLGENSSVWNGAVLRGDMHYIKIGKNVNVQDNAIIHGTSPNYPTTVGDNVSIGHAAIVHGCKIGNNCIIGMGAIVLEGVEVGDWCIIGAGSVITEGAKIPGGSLVVGVPGQIIKNLTTEQKERITRNWKNYISLKNDYIETS